MLIGIIAVAGAATLLGIMPSMQKTLLVNGLPMNSLMFFTNLTISLVCLIMARLKGRSLKASRIQLIQALIMGASGMMFTALLLNTSYLYLPVGTAPLPMGDIWLPMKRGLPTSCPLRQNCSTYPFPEP